MSRYIELIRHGNEPLDDRVSTWLSQNSIRASYKTPCYGDAIGKPRRGLVGTVLFGGGFNVYETEENPFLLEESRWIEDCLAADVPILGICQGAQQIARHLGAWVGAPEVETHEFGYYRVDPVDETAQFMPRPLYFAQAHYHTFDIPAGARLLARSEAFEHQAFSYGDKVFGLQFHAEQTIERVQEMAACRVGGLGQTGAQNRLDQDKLMMQHDRAQADWFYAFMDNLFNQAIVA